MSSRSSLGRFSRIRCSRSRNFVIVRTLVAICSRSVAMFGVPPAGSRDGVAHASRPQSARSGSHARWACFLGVDYIVRRTTCDRRPACPARANLGHEIQTSSGPDRRGSWRLLELSAACSYWKTQSLSQLVQFVFASGDERERNDETFVDHHERALPHVQLASWLVEVPADQLPGADGK